MSLEDQLERELRETAERLPSPSVSMADLLRAGQREQRRRGLAAVAGGVAVAAVAVALVVVPRALSSSDAQPVDPSPTSPTPPTASSATHARPTWADLPVGDPTDVPWWQDGTLHVDGSEIATPLRLIAYRGGTTVVGRSGIDGAEWQIVVDGGLRPLVSSDGPLWPVVSSDGSRIAWVEERGREQLTRYKSLVHYRLVLYDVASRTEIGHLDQDEHTMCCDASGTLTILGITLDGRVIASSLGRAAFAWMPTATPTTLSGPGVERLDAQSWPGGVTWQGRSADIFDLPAEYGTIDASGRISPVGLMPTESGVWSADGTAYAYPGLDDGTAPAKDVLDHLWVRRTDSHRLVELQIPAKPLYTAIAWESDDEVLVEARQPFGEPGAFAPGIVGLLRCSAETGDCERVADGPTGGAVVPDPY